MGMGSESQCLKQSLFELGAYWDASALKHMSLNCNCHIFACMRVDNSRIISGSKRRPTH